MGRHAVWWLQGDKFTDPAGRYLGGIVYTRGAIPPGLRPGRTCLHALCVLDAYDPVPEWDAVGQAWGQLVAQNDWWLRDSEGERIGGWARGRWAVDLSKPQLPEALCEILDSFAVAESAWSAGWHLDDLCIRMFWRAPGIDASRWAANAMAIAHHVQAAPWQSSLNAGKLYYEPPELMACFDVWKLEGFRPHPFFWGGGWAGPSGNPYTWHDWFDGRAGNTGLAGYFPSSHDKTVVLECWYEEGWTPEHTENYYRLAMGTVLLGDGRIMAHHGGGDWWRDPYWDQSFEWPQQLGEPTRPPCPCDKDRLLWVRQFEHGTLLLNATPYLAFLEHKSVPAHDARVVLQ